MVRKSNFCMVFWDEAVDVFFMENTVLGPRILLMERLTRSENTATDIAGCLSRTEKNPARATLCLPRSIVMQRTLHYPALVLEDIGGMIQLEAARHVPLPEEERALAYRATASADGKEAIIDLLAARRPEIRALIDGLIAQAVPVDQAVSFSSLIAPLAGVAPTLLVVSDVRSVELCLYGNGLLQDSQLLSRTAPGFSDARTAAAVRQMAAKHKAWLGDEGIGRILTAGPEPIAPALSEELGTAFGLRVHTIELPVALQEAVTESKAALLVEPLLAALTEMPATLNLIEHTDRRVPLSRRTIVVAALCALLAVELLAALGMRSFAPSLQRRTVERDLAEAKRAALPVQRLQEKNRELRTELVRLDEICRSHMSMMEVLRVLSEKLPEHTYLRSVSFSGREGCRIRGLSKEPDTLPALIESLPMVAAISQLEIGDKNDESYHDFSISVTLRSPADEKTVP